MAANQDRAQFSLHEAETNLSRLVERAAAGEEIIIGKPGEPMARLGPIPRPVTSREPGHWRGKVVIRDDFDQLPAT